MKHLLINLVIAMLCIPCTVLAANPKREFRGAWIHTVGQGQYAKQSTEENKAYLIDILDKLKAAGVNAIVFQVRPSADAFYESSLEPWSRFLSGKAGVAPSPEWDPLQFMIEQSHARGMELHAWLNPYRVTTSPKEVLPENHIYYKHPERFVKFDGKMYFNPGLPENREFIEKVVRDIVNRYDVDAIHMDDYFYPYPKQGEEFPDAAAYKKYGNGLSIGDWRRENVNLLIEGLHEVIAETKPWVRLGISPFGVWRNKSEDPTGSDTKALTNYDGLYADVTLWTAKGWVDYMLPQLYWELEHPRASSEILAYWWDKNANGRHMYFGQDVMKTMSKHDLAPSSNPTQLDHKISLSRSLPNVQGNCWWPGYSIVKNYLGVADSLANNQQSTIAIVPSYPWIDNVAPEAVKNVKVENGKVSWNRVDTDDKMQIQRSFVVYYFEEGKAIDLDDSKAIMAITYDTEYSLPKHLGKGVIAVTALDAVNNESVPSTVALK